MFKSIFYESPGIHEYVPGRLLLLLLLLFLVFYEMMMLMCRFRCLWCDKNQGCYRPAFNTTGQPHRNDVWKKYLCNTEEQATPAVHTGQTAMHGGTQPIAANQIYTAFSGSFYNIGEYVAS